jgi:hypothetical protein
MQFRFARPLMILAWPVIVAGCVERDTTFSRRIVDADTRRPIVGAQVFVGADSLAIQNFDHPVSDAQQCMTNNDGRVACHLKYSPVTMVKINAPGYYPFFYDRNGNPESTVWDNTLRLIPRKNPQNLPIDAKAIILKGTKDSQRIPLAPGIVLVATVKAPNCKAALHDTTYTSLSVEHGEIFFHGIGESQFYAARSIQKELPYSKTAPLQMKGTYSLYTDSGAIAKFYVRGGSLTDGCPYSVSLAYNLWSLVNQNGTTLESTQYMDAN